jgi:hypothetical protein
VLNAIRRVALPVVTGERVSVSPDESDNRFPECAEAARADYPVTGNAKHFPERYKTTTIVSGRRFLDVMSGSD